MSDSSTIVPTPESAKQLIRKLVPEILTLVKCLPDTLPLASADDPIADRFARVEHNDWESFDRVINALFGEDTRVDGRLPNACFRGPRGMQFVADYLEKAAKEGWIEWVPALPKYQRIHDELEFLSKYVLVALFSVPVHY